MVRSPLRYIIIASTVFLWFFSSQSETHAAIIYTPGNTISMTGTTSESRFDVAELLFWAFGSNDYKPVLVTSTKTFSWAFYVNAIGWIEFNTGSYQVSMNCWAQPLNNLTSNCNLSWTGWSELVWEVNFRSIEYLHTTRTLSWSIKSNAGDFSVSGIPLPLKPAELNEDITKLKANTTATFSISWTSQYAGSIWNMQYTPKLAPFPSLVVWDATGKFIADISYADNYSITVIDPDGWSTTLDGVVSSEEVDIGNFDSSNNLIHGFCATYPANCPDGNIPIATNKSQNPVGWVIADGNDFYHVTIKSRDRFGNRATSGSASIIYDATVTSVQLLGNTTGPITWISSFTGDSLIFSGQIFTPDMTNHLWKSNSINLYGQDIVYDISSVTPTDSSHTVSLSSIEYTKPDNSKIPYTDATPIIFVPAFESVITPTGMITIDSNNSFKVSTTKNTSLGFTPDIIPILSIGDGTNAAFQNFTSTEPISCQANESNILSYNGNCDWITSDSVWYPSIVSFQTTTPVFSMTGDYVSATPDPPEESVNYASYIHYTIWNLGPISGIYFWSNDITYVSKNGNLGNSAQSASKVIILGQNTSKRHDGLDISKSERAKLTGTIRKNAAVLSRNRTSYADVPYTIHQWNLTVDNASFNDKRTILVIWGDIKIVTNIDAHSDPLAIIAITDTQGNGGNIDIDPSVTDIHASLISEHSINSSWDRQLYIHGSLISANTMGWTASSECPYYVAVACTNLEAKKYDIEKIRIFDGSNPAKKSIAPICTQYPTNPVIIEYDMSIVSNPPPILTE